MFPGWTVETGPERGIMKWLSAPPSQAALTCAGTRHTGPENRLLHKFTLLFKLDEGSSNKLLKATKTNLLFDITVFSEYIQCPMYVLDYKATKPLPRVRYLTNVLVALVTANLTADTFTAGSFGP